MAFYAEYFKYIESVVLVDHSLYHYYQRATSVTHVFNPTSKLGVQKACYILNKFSSLARETSIDAKCYEPDMARRWIGLILNQTKNVWNKKSPMKMKEKRAFLLWAIKEANIKAALNQMQYVRYSRVERVILWAIEHNNIFLLSCYGICYNVARNMRDKIKKIIR